MYHERTAKEKLLRSNNILNITANHLEWQYLSASREYHICFAILIKLTGSQQLLLSTKSPKPGVSTYARINWVKCDYFWFYSCFSDRLLTGTTSKNSLKPPQNYLLCQNQTQFHICTLPLVVRD